MTKFTDLGLSAPLLQAVTAEGYDTPTPIQAQAITPVMQGRDLLGIAQTGTGKTAAFALPILHRLTAEGNHIKTPRGSCRVLVLSPTRELASQIAESFRVYGKFLNLSVATVFGGVSAGPQIKALQRGVDIVVATPGRLIDHLQSRSVRLDQVEIFVLDEADQMLDMGFILPIRRIVKTLSAKRQNLFFSATMPREIEGLAGELLVDPVKVAVTPVASTAERVAQQVIFVPAGLKRALLADLLTDQQMGFGRTLVFSRTKHGADKIVRSLEAAGIVSAAIHGNKSQAQRERALAAFRDGACKVLIATDIAARGIDVDGVTHVINFDLPNIPESYVHRIGRTARAGANGMAISFCDREERSFLRDIEKLIRQKVPELQRALPEGAVATPEEPREERRGRPQGRPQNRSDNNRPSNRPAQGRPQGQRNGNGNGGQRQDSQRQTRPAEGGDESMGGLGFMKRPDGGQKPQGAKPASNANRPAERSGERTGERTGGDRPWRARKAS
ncbi:MAG: DEAD/DEAH box helicase [Alphaproteobacteria bacterium]|nr:DEAD/DEAH box helicase [Alphaproteobacteria bacterium]MBU2091147.1 DEAD/DEAH box helicase [Alphaproteobacteria bacterium]